MMDKHTHNAQNVVAMSNYQPETGYAAIAQVEAYWEAIRGNRLLPKRSDIDPRGIEQALENAFIVERVAPGIARLRVAGSHLQNVMGMEVRGMPLTTFFTASARSAVADMLEVVFQTPAIGSLKLASAAGPDRDALEGRMILLPLKSDLGDVSRVLGCLVTKGKIGLSPRRFDILSQKTVHIGDGAAAVAPSERELLVSKPQDVPTPSEQRGLREEQKDFLGQKSKKRPPYLRLVKSED